MKIKDLKAMLDTYNDDLDVCIETDLGYVDVKGLAVYESFVDDRFATKTYQTIYENELAKGKEISPIAVLI